MSKKKALISTFIYEEVTKTDRKLNQSFVHFNHFRARPKWGRESKVNLCVCVCLGWGLCWQGVKEEGWGGVEGELG